MLKMWHDPHLKYMFTTSASRDTCF